MTLTLTGSRINRLVQQIIFVAAAFSLLGAQEVRADAYSEAQYHCRKAWCEPVPKIKCCWQYCAYTACTKTAPWDAVYTMCSPQKNTYETCMRNAAQPSSVGFWKMRRNAGIPGHNIEIHYNITLSQCKQICVGRRWCKSVDFERDKGTCYVQDANMFDAQLRTDYPGNPYDHYWLTGRR